MSTPIRAGKAALFLLFLAGGLFGASAQEPSPAGHWEGSIQVPGEELGIDVDLVFRNGSWTGDISIPVQQIKDFPLGGITVEGMNVRFGMEGVPGAPGFNGTLSEDGQSITGTWSQGGQSFPFTLKRS